MKRDFKGVWIPKELWLNNDLTLVEKCLLVEIHSLDNQKDKGCFASNEYFAKFFGKSTGTMANLIVKLKKDGYIEQVFFDGRNRGLRVIQYESSLHKNMKPDFTKRLKQRSQKSDHNNTSNNTSKDNNSDKSLFHLFVEAHHKFYRDRVGVDYRFNGKADGQNMKNIMAYLEKIVTKGTPLEAWQMILDRYESWSTFHQGQLKVTQINSNLPNILNEIKNGNSKKSAIATDYKTAARILEELNAENGNEGV